MTRTIQPPNVTVQEFDQPIIVERHMYSEQYAIRIGLDHTEKVSGVAVTVFLVRQNDIDSSVV